jgi:hypothetical protein
MAENPLAAAALAVLDIDDEALVNARASIGEECARACCSFSRAIAIETCAARRHARDQLVTDQSC